MVSLPRPSLNQQLWKVSLSVMAMLMLSGCGKEHTKVPVAAVKKSIAPYVMPDEKAVFAQYAGAMSCAGCHAEAGRETG
jgi:hypothetical protein